jgi:outer membrane protein
MLQRRMFFILFLLLWSGLEMSGHAAPTARSLEECFQAAWQRSAVLASRREEILQAEERLAQARAALLPAFTAEAAWQADGFASQTAYKNSAMLSINQPLFRGFAEFAAIASAGAQIQAKKLARQWASAQLYLDVVQAFYATYAAQRDLVHIQEQIALYERRIQDLQARVAIGRSRESEVLAVRSALAEVKANRHAAEGDYAAGLEILAFLTGWEAPLALQADAGPIPSPEQAQVYLDSLAGRADLQAAEANLRAAHAAIALAQSGHWPQATAQAHWYVLEQAQDKKWDAQIAFSLPLFSGGAVLSQTREAQSIKRAQKLALEHLRRQLGEETRIRLRALASYTDQLAAYREAADLAQKNHAAMLRDYNLGLVDNLDVLQALASQQAQIRAAERVFWKTRHTWLSLEIFTARRMPAMPAKGQE